MKVQLVTMPYLAREEKMPPWFFHLNKLYYIPPLDLILVAERICKMVYRYSIMIFQKVFKNKPFFICFVVVL